MTNAVPGKALIVDDEKTNRFILRIMLKKQGMETIEAVDGEQAVALFKSESPDIVFMDVMMPVMDGYEATRQIKALSGNQFVPIIFLTAMTDEAALRQCIEAGGDDFLIKPYDQFMLQTKIHSMQRIASLNREIRGMYSMIHREQEIAESVFVKAIQSSNIENPFLRQIVRPASVFSGDMILSAYSPSRDLLFLTGDFTGHGLSAALGAMPVSEVFRAMTSKGFSPEDLLIGINKKLKQLLPVGMFFGAQLVVVSQELDHVRIFNAGMPDVLVVDGETNKIKARIESTGLPLGVVQNIEPKEMSRYVPISLNDKILMYSDGLIEARDVNDNQFGDERLNSAIESASTNKIFDQIFVSLDEFCGEQTAQPDDVTLVEITCVHDVLPEVELNEYIRPSMLHAGDKGEWKFSLRFNGPRLRATNPVPILVNHIMEMESLEAERQSLFTVMTELYVNALDHGVLGLDSALKSDPTGFARYFGERESRLKELETGYVLFNLSVEQISNKRRILLRIEDSGDGFDYKSPRLPVANDIALSGRGILLINDLCESLEYHGRGNIAVAMFAWNTQSAEKD